MNKYQVNLGLSENFFSFNVPEENNLLSHYEDEDYFLLFDGYVINEGQLLTNTAKGTEGDFKKILLESFINGIDLHTDLELL